MTTPSGQLYLSQVNDELRQPGAQRITMGDERVRLLAEVWGQIYMSQLRGKNAMTANINAGNAGFAMLTGYQQPYYGPWGYSDNPWYRGVEVLAVTTNSLTGKLTVVMYTNLPQWTWFRYIEIWRDGVLQIRRHVDQMVEYSYNPSDNSTTWRWDWGGFQMADGAGYQIRLYSGAY